MQQPTTSENQIKVKKFDKHWFTPPRDPRIYNDAIAFFRMEKNTTETCHEHYITDILDKLTDDELQLLLPQVRLIYSDDMTNREERPKIIKALLSIDPKQRDQFVQQLLFLFANYTNAHDRMWMTMMLSNIKDPNERATLVKNVHFLYTPNMQSTDRAHLLHAFIHKTTAQQIGIVQRFIIAGNEEATRILASLKDFSVQLLREPQAGLESETRLIQISKLLK